MGNITSASISGVVETSQSLNTLAAAMNNLFTQSRFENFSDSDMGDTAAAFRSQGTAPSNVVGDFWNDSNSSLIRSYYGPTGEESWNPIGGSGLSAKNGTGGALVQSDVVYMNPTSAGSNNRTVIGPGSSNVAGVAAENSSKDDWLALWVHGVRQIHVAAGAVRGNYVGNGTGVNAAVSATFEGSFGVLLSDESSNLAWALIRPYMG